MKKGIKKKKHGTATSIQKKLLKVSIAIICISLFLLGTVAIVMNYSAAVTSLEQTMTETVKIAAGTVRDQLEGYRKLANEFCYNTVLTKPNGTSEEITAECDALAARNNLAVVDCTDAGGNSLKSGISVADRDYFIQAKETGKTYVSDPVVRKDNGEMNIFVAAPVLEGDTFKGIIFVGIDASFLCDLVTNITIGETGNASIIGKTGDTIGYKDVQLVLDAYNTQNELKNDKQLKELAAVEQKVLSGESGFDTYSYGGVKKFAAYAPVEGTGWGMYVAVEQKEFLRMTYIGMYVVIIVLILSILAGSILMKRLAVSISSPIELCVNRMQLLAQGDLSSEVPQIKTGDETQVLAESTAALVDNLKLVIRDINYCLTEMANSNFAINSNAKKSYVGEFENILNSINTLNGTLSVTLRDIIESSGQVAMGAQQMAQSAQSLAEGATDQAGAVEELTAAIMDVSSLAEDSAVKSQNAFQTAEKSSRMAEGSSEEIVRLTGAMERISDTSKEIEQIISAIEEIASQTNLLSLNASIEAARAGESGRGFAVVADQIGKLASDSAQSAVTTRELIVKSIKEVEEGNNITLKTAEELNAMIESMKQLAEMAYGSSEASSTQAQHLKEVEKGIEQISEVVQSNSAAAEETSATSEELTAQSEAMNELVGKFQLKE